MKIAGNNKDILKVLTQAQKAISNKAALPVLTGIKLTADMEKGLIATATDLEFTIQARVPVEVLEEGSVVLPARYIVDLLKNLGSAVSIESNSGAGVTIRYGICSETSINGFLVDEFPEFAPPSSDREIILNGTQFKNAIRRVAFAAATDGKPIFMGVFMEAKGTELSMVATDTYRLAWQKISLPEPVDEIKAIVPAKTLNELSKIIEDGREVKITLADSQVLFALGDVVIVSRIIDGVFPDYGSVIPKEFPAGFTARTKEVLDAVNRAVLLAEGQSVTKMSLNGKFTIGANSEAGKVHEEVKADITGNGIEIAFNSRYLADCLKAIGAEEITMNFTGPQSPGVVRPVNDQNYFSLVLPVRV